jgi:uroporphyrinogen III methyltransferase/synthase
MVLGGHLELLGGYASPDGSQTAFARRRGPVASGEDLGRELAAEIDARARIRATAGHVDLDGERAPARRILVTRAVDQAGEMMSALCDAGLEPVLVPAIAFEFEPPRGDLDAAARLLHTYAWVVITSANGARAMLKAAERVFTALETSKFAVIGPATRGILEREGIAVDYQPPEASATSMAAGLPLEPDDRVAVIRGDLADNELPITLRARGAEVDDVIAYRTREAPDASRILLRRAISDGPIAAVGFTSGSTVRGLVKLARDESIDVLSVPAVCIGPETADEARATGFQVLAISPAPDATALAAATARALAIQPQEVS